MGLMQRDSGRLMPGHYSRRTDREICNQRTDTATATSEGRRFKNVFMNIKISKKVYIYMGLSIYKSKKRKLMRRDRTLMRS